MTNLQEYSQLNLSDILHSLNHYYMVTQTDDEGLITSVNKNFLTTSSWTPKRILGKTIWQMFDESETAQTSLHTIWSELQEGKTWFGTAKKSKRTGETYYTNMLAIPTMSEEDTLLSALFLELDITESVELKERLEQIAFIDLETNLMSRHRLEVLVNEMIQEEKSFSFVYLSIDHYYTLKELQAGTAETELTQAFANRLKRYFQDNPIARTGSSQFVVLTPFGDWYVQGFLDFLKQQPIYVGSEALPLSISGSIVRYPEDQKSFVNLVEASSMTLEEVRLQGGGRITSLSASSHKVLDRRSLINRKLLTALDHNALQVVYQPQYDIAQKTITVYEALVRWEDEELGTVSPDELIPIAEANGLITNIGSYVLTEAAQLAVKLNDFKGAPHVSVNTSVREFSNQPMKNNILGILQVNACVPSQLELEITEKFAFQAEEEQSIIQQMKELQDAGVSFILDDFGTGYASFRYMQHLPISKIKIDKVYTDALLTHPKTQQLVEGMIRFGKSMGLYTIAEGVETKAQFDALTTMGVDAVQGYYIGTPVLAESILK
ncbi:EAL domain-containing protein [Sporosarcina aquimarina]|uniref:EAL domain-containing protein n=1 Tax=Sporosarcina aquimarina TaxID=114975 RepID=A0ABU4FV16_9BACL|nr:EAL domain-containing protein [Sporosarcina aquimarina]MDW0108552.1 EAL domain-containing protein [Sporosarcina aquimarina]